MWYSARTLGERTSSRPRTLKPQSSVQPRQMQQDEQAYRCSHHTLWSPSSLDSATLPFFPFDVVLAPISARGGKIKRSSR